MKKFLNKFKLKLARLKRVLQKEYDIDSYVIKLLKAVKENTISSFTKLNVVLHKDFDIDTYVKKSFKASVKSIKIACVKLNLVLHKEFDLDFYVKKLFKAIKNSDKNACVKLNIILHKEVNLDYYILKSAKIISESSKRIYLKLKTALKKEHDLDSYVKKALKSLAVFIVSCSRLFNSPSRLFIHAAAAAAVKARKIFISLSTLAILQLIIIRTAAKQRRNNKVKARLEQERENIAFLTEFLSSLKADFGADISFSLIAVNDEDNFDVINEH